jgi:hypothetical protein
MTSVGDVRRVGSAGFVLHSPKSLSVVEEVNIRSSTNKTLTVPLIVWSEFTLTSQMGGNSTSLEGERPAVWILKSEQKNRISYIGRPSSGYRSSKSCSCAGVSSNPKCLFDLVLGLADEDSKLLISTLSIHWPIYTYMEAAWPFPVLLAWYKTGWVCTPRVSALLVWL